MVIIMNKKIGDSSDIDEPIAYLHTNREDKIEECIARLSKSYTITDTNANEHNKTVIGVVK